MECGFSQADAAGEVEVGESSGVKKARDASERELRKAAEGEVCHVGEGGDAGAYVVGEARGPGGVWAGW